MVVIQMESDILIHAPVKGATRCIGPTRRNTRYFNPRSREGSDAPGELHAGPERISIHAHVKGATPVAGSCMNSLPISIHAPVKGATFQQSRCVYRIVYFNPRSREGSDISVAKVIVLPSISIHAPVKGATPHDESSCAVVLISIHAPVKGATFQQSRCVYRIVYFNPRSLEGSDTKTNTYDQNAY